MPVCQNCGYEWSWRETAKIGIGFKYSKKCPNCNKKQYVVPNMRRDIGFYYFIPSILLLIFDAIFQLSTKVFLSIGILFVLVIVITFPYTIKLSNEQEPLW